MTTESTKHLKLLEEKIREKNFEIEKFIVINEVDDESGSGSGSGRGNIILHLLKSTVLKEHKSA